MVDILGSGKCSCLNKVEKEKLLIAIYRTIESYSANSRNRNYLKGI